MRRPGFSVYATILGSPSREQRNADLAALLRWGLTRYRVESVIGQGRTYALAADRLRPRSARARRRVAVRGARSASTGRSWRASSQRRRSSLPVRAGQRLGTIRVYDGKRLLAARAARRRARGLASGARGARRFLRAAHGEAHLVLDLVT